MSDLPLFERTVDADYEKLAKRCEIYKKALEEIINYRPLSHTPDTLHLVEIAQNAIKEGD